MPRDARAHRDCRIRLVRPPSLLPASVLSAFARQARGLDCAPVSIPKPLHTFGRHALCFTKRARRASGNAGMEPEMSETSAPEIIVAGTGPAGMIAALAM